MRTHNVCFVEKKENYLSDTKLPSRSMNTPLKTAVDTIGGEKSVMT